MSNANRDYAIIYDVKNSSLVLSRPLIFYITDQNTSNIFVRLVTKVNIGNGVDQYTDIEEASSYVLTMRVIKPNNEVNSIEATQHEEASIFQFDLTENFKDIPGKYICELTISNIVNERQELITSDPFNYEVKRSILSNISEIIETEDTTVEKLLNNLEASKVRLFNDLELAKTNLHNDLESTKSELSSKVQTNDNKIENIKGELSSQIKEKANKNELKVHFIKLNNFGESILVQFDNKNMLVDFGKPEDKETVLSYLRKYNVSKLDYIIITHYHIDHIGTLEYVLNNMDISECIAYLPCEPDFNRFNKNGPEFKSATSKVYNILDNKNIEKIFPSENQIVNLGEIDLKFNNCNLSYFESYYDTVSEYATNGETDYYNFSLVTTLIHEDIKVLLTSDINMPVQEKIIGDISKCNVYKTEHHSVNSLVSEAFLNKVNPEISVCCNVEQTSIFVSQTSLYHFKNKKEYYLTYRGDVVVCSNGKRAFVKSNNKRFEGEANVYYNFQSAIDNFDSNIELIEIVKAIPSGSKLIGDLRKSDACCPSFVSDYNAIIEIYKTSPKRATLTIKDFDYNKIKTFDGIWHSANGNEIKWSKNINSDNVIKCYKSLEELDPTYNENTALISLVKKMENNSKLLEVEIAKGHACCPSFVSSYNATIEIFKTTPNKATLAIRDFDYNEIKVYKGIWHSGNGDTIKWGNVRFENEKELITYNSMPSLYSLGINNSSDALTILKALPTGGFYSGHVEQAFASFLSSWGGMATIEKMTGSQGRIILSDANPALGKTWIGLYHSGSGDVIKWSLLNSTLL